MLEKPDPFLNMDNILAALSSGNCCVQIDRKSFFNADATTQLIKRGVTINPEMHISQLYQNRERKEISKQRRP